jgi:predicted transposase/invertase (TIGR01784 family)
MGILATFTPMAQDYDKIFREVLKDIFPVVAQKLLGIPSGHYQPLPGDLQYTSEREADQLWQVTPAEGESFVLHCEFQSTNDRQMLSRMLLYYGFLYYQKKLPIYQYVLYVGKEPLQMEAALQARNLTFSYQLVDLRSFPYQAFLESTHSEEVLLAILADFKGEPEELVAEKIIAKLGELSAGQLELSQRAVQLIRLAVLRNLGKTVFNVTQKMAITIDVKEDTFYQLGQEEGLQKGKEEGKEEAALNMLKEGFAPEVVVRLTKLTAERVSQLHQQWQAGK